jgi:hemolysin III
MTWLHVREPVSAWTHFAWMVLAIPATWALWRLNRGCALKRIGGVVFGLTLGLCYASSWLFHSVPPALAGPFATLDHIGITLFIAGTVTPIALVVLEGRWRWGLLAGIWALALGGAALRLTMHPSIVQLTGYYLFMGWVGLLMYFELARRLSHAAVRPIWIGGLCYSVGAIINGLHWPVLAPGVFGSHEVFHLFVMAGSACHYWFMLSTLVPYQGVLAGEALTTHSPALPLVATMAVGHAQEAS